MAAGRKRKLFRPYPGANWHVRFVHQGKDILRSLGTRDENSAKIKAVDVVEAEINGDEQTARALKMRADYANLRELGDRYIEKFGTDVRRKRTARGNVGCLEKIVRLGAKLSLENASAKVLTDKLVRTFETAEVARIVRDRQGNFDMASELRVRTSIGSTLRQARSVFSRKILHWFDGMNLPDLSAFKNQGVQTVERPKPRRLDQLAIASMFEAAPKLAKDDPGTYIAFMMMALLGMRNSEIRYARRAWIEQDDRGRWSLGVRIRPEHNFRPKKKTERDIPVGEDMLALFKKYYKQSPDGDFLVPAGTKTEREIIVMDRLRIWVGQYIKGYSKKSYELRRYAGSLMLKKTGRLDMVKEFLGHASIKTTEEWYAYTLGDLPALSLEDFQNGHGN